MQVVPLQPSPNQTLNVNLNNQNCKLAIYQKFAGLFCDLYVNDVLIMGGMIAQNLNRMVRSKYLPFLGDLAFGDLQGTTDPIYMGLGGRYVLFYLEPADLPTSEFA